MCSTVIIWHCSGNTSACAEKSAGAELLRAVLRKYLRVCGEETIAALIALLPAEIPPRVRRRAVAARLGLDDMGNTSACAEKSGSVDLKAVETVKYLRVCGEESLSGRYLFHGGEIPPRVRRRDEELRPVLVEMGNTSACAEKSDEA